jgi:glucuronate isomerase
LTTTSEPYITPDFMLSCRRARQLYHEHAAVLPIIDFHCHLSPALIAEDHQFRNMAEIWLAGDHYKWRAMRTNGVPERYVTGDASDWEKFEQWAQTMPAALRSPLYQWTHMELARPFGITDRLLGPDTAREIWDEANAKLQLPEFSTRGLIRQFGVEVICTTDDPCDDLQHHRQIAADTTFPVGVYPTFRPDKALLVDNPEAWNQWLDRLGAASGSDISTFDAMIGALRKRAEFFHEAGCRLSDQAFEQACESDSTPDEVAAAFAQLRAGKQPDGGALRALRFATLHELGLLYHELGWAMQIHIGPLRNNSTRMFRDLGPDAGFDSMSDAIQARALSRLLDSLDLPDRLPKTILYNLNPAWNEMLATMIGNFQDGSVRGKMQLGSAWWFMDQRDGIVRMLEAVSNMGLLSTFVGMLTDSRSFLSYPRHDYFRRTLCDVVGSDMERGLIPDDLELAAETVRKVCYFNAKEYFGFGKKPGSV